LEAYGAGIALKKGDIAIRCNLALEKNGLLRNVEAGITNEEGMDLAKIISRNIQNIAGVKIIFKHTVGYRAVLVLRGKNLSARISNTHPGYGVYRDFVSEALPARSGVVAEACKPLDSSKEAARTAEIVNKFLAEAKKILITSGFEEKANIILTRGAGTELPKLQKLGQKWVALVDMPAEKALAKLMGMEIASKAKSFDKLAGQTLRALKKYRAVYVHIKDTDIFSHKGNFYAKKKVIEEFNGKFLAKVVHKADLGKTVICITGDHSTPCELGAHSADPVPVLLYSPDEIGDCLRFGESFAAKGSLGKMNSVQLFAVLQKLLLFD
jgi:2,3-bisphosphoglycerate-independent phosphoglycerate mutase